MKPNLAFIFQGGAFNLMACRGQMPSQPPFLSVISHQIMIQLLWRGYLRFLCERKLIFLSFIAGATHTRL